MAKIMIFIDGTWLYSSQRHLAEIAGENVNIDYGKLPKVVAEVIAKNLNYGGVDIVRTYLFGSNAKGHQEADDLRVQKRKQFYDTLREEYNYDVEVYNVDYRGKRLRKQDRDPDDDFTPTEKCVDIALASSMLYYAAQPFAYEIAILVGGDRDYVPMLKKVRRLGKRVAIASIRKTCSYSLSNPKDKEGVRDFDLIWLDDYVEDVRLKPQMRQVRCESENHEGVDLVWTDEFVRKNRPYYCRECREKTRLRRQEEGSYPYDYDGDNGDNGHHRDEDRDEPYNDAPATEERQPVQPGHEAPERRPFVYSVSVEDFDYEDLQIGETCVGVIKKLMDYCGFIGTPLGDFYFGADNCIPEMPFRELRLGDKVEFIIQNMPNPELRGGRGNGNAVEVDLLPESEEA